MVNQHGANVTLTGSARFFTSVRANFSYFNVPPGNTRTSFYDGGQGNANNATAAATAAGATVSTMTVRNC
jgi:hypothetical protein